MGFRFYSHLGQAILKVSVDISVCPLTDIYTYVSMFCHSNRILPLASAAFRGMLEEC